jgi:hypothetical protein
VNKRPFIERRKGHDFWFFALKLMALMGWAVFIIALVISHYAVPEQNYGLVRYHNIPIRDFWAYPLTSYLYYILWANAGFSFITIWVNHYRSRRVSDISGYNSTLLLLITLAWLAYLSFNIQ